MLPYFLALPALLFPYSILGMLYCLFSGVLMESVFQNNGWYGVLALLIWAMLGFAGAVGAGISGYRMFDCRRMARFTMWVKLLQIPAYCIIAVLGALFTFTIFTIGFTIAFAFFDVLAIAMTGILGAFSVGKCHRKGLLNRADWLVYTLLQFVFCVDVVSSILLYRKAKK